jgi:Tol biopolymer transport system component/DNA-binding winged helix-turn-helix (wHTH) protein
MAETGTQLRPIRFGNFEVDLRAGELRRGGVKLKFGGQPFQVLTILLERPGEVVTREELQKRLWPDTFVDVDHNLNTAINKIREVLGDSAESPRFVETLPRRGYRFIGEPAPPVQAEVPVVPVPGPQPRQIRLKIAASVVALAAVALAAVGGYRWLRPQRQSTQEQANVTAVPFTALPGQATSPAFSPDGSRIAFAWNADPKGGARGFDLYVKALGSETLLRLTQHPAEWISPTWSPDGTQIAFHRMDGADTGIYLVPALGGPERKLRSTRMPWDDPFSIISWSADGKWIAFADVLPGEEYARIYLLSTETLETSQVPISPKCVGEGLPAFSHDGEYLAYWCFRSVTETVLYSLPISGGQPKLIATFRSFPGGLTWSADDKNLIYSVYPFGNATSAEIGEINIASGWVRQLGLTGNGELPTVSPRGDRLAYSSSSSGRLNIWRKDLLRPESPAVELIPSSRAQYDAQYSPDGKRVAIASERSGVQGVWISNEDGSNLVQISNPNYVSGSPQWSPDGNKIAFDSRPLDRPEIYVADVSERIPRKLVTNLSNVYRPHWSRDGKWIYFRSDEIGSQGIYRCPASGGDAIALSKDPEGRFAQESFDGGTVYFTGGLAKPVLMKLTLPPHPGTESAVDGFPQPPSRLWTLSRAGIYFVPTEVPRSLRYFDFATRQVRQIFEDDKEIDGSLSLSPDGRWILYSQTGDVTGDIMLVDHFH